MKGGKIIKNNETRCLTAEQYSLEEILKICELSDKIRKICETKEGADYIQSLLSDKRAMIYFKQSSTRTFLSFMNACHILGIKCSEIRDTKTSSEVKGESEEDAVMTFAQYTDMLIARHPDATFHKRMAEILPENIRIINGGSGTDQHPTQAMLDFYTILTTTGFEGKKIAMVGDLKRGRTVHSLTKMLAMVKDLELYFIAPNGYQMNQDILDELVANKISFNVTDEMDELLPELDVVYMTRVQKEYGGVDIAWNPEQYCLNLEKVENMKEEAIIMHPLPRNNEITIDVDKNKRALYMKQVRNGLWVRAALIASMFDLEKEEIVEDYKKLIKR